MTIRLWFLMGLLIAVNGCVTLSLNKKAAPNTKAGKLDYFKKQIASNHSDLVQHFSKKRDFGIKACINRIIDCSIEIKKIGIEEKYQVEIDEITSSMRKGLEDFKLTKSFRLVESNFNNNYSKLKKLYVKVNNSIVEEKE